MPARVVIALALAWLAGCGVGCSDAHPATDRDAGARDAGARDAEAAPDGDPCPPTRLRWLQRAEGGDVQTGRAALVGSATFAVGPFGDRVVFDRGGPREAIFYATGPERSTPAIYLARLDERGAFEWAERIAAGETMGEVRAFAASGDGILVAGGFGGNIEIGPHGEATLTSPSNHATWLGVFDANGELRWASAVRGDGGHVFPQAIAPATVGGVVMVGAGQGAVVFDAGEPEELRLSAGWFTARFRADGSLAAAHRLEPPSEWGPAHNLFAALISGNDIYVSGQLCDPGPCEADHESQAYRAFVTRFGADSVPVWTVVAAGDLGSYSSLFPIGVAGERDPALVLVGYSSGDVTFGAGEAGEVHLTGEGSLLARLSPEGRLVRANRIAQGIAGDRLIATLRGEQTYAVMSFSNEDLAGCAFSDGSPGIALARFDASHRRLSLTPLGRPPDPIDGIQPGDVAVADDGSVLVVGSLQGTADLAGGTLVSAGFRDGWFARLEP